MKKKQEFSVLLTGVTGFVGKVVLEELLKKRAATGVERVSVLIRPAQDRKGKVLSPQERFDQSVATAEVFRALPPQWESLVDVVSCDLEQPQCGISDADYAALCERTTHLIHCAASVEFDLPVQEAARANITTALQVLDLAKACKKLVGMVDVSTAYVSVWNAGPFTEKLAHIPRPAAEYHQAITSGSRSEAELLKETGHPNTYTFTKCVTEHLLAERRGHVPLTIVRPSIVSAAWKTPFPGWLDSPAALAGCLLYTGLGLVRAFNADPSVRLDVVPVDVVAQVILQAAFEDGFAKPSESVAIRYAVMGIANALRIDTAALATIAFFKERPGAKRVPGMFIGREDHGFGPVDLVRRQVRTQVQRAMLFAFGRKRDRKRLEKVNEKVIYLNSAFRYFTHRTFDFQPARSAVPAGFEPLAYTDVINRGLYRHLLKLDDTEMPIAGYSHDDARDDFSWVRERKQGSLPMRTLALGLRKALRRCTSGVTFDRPSFERAVKAAPADALFILAPSHRSYFDFLLSSYLCLQHPELGIDVPHIAAAEEFGKIPLVGSVLRASRAFYIKRGVGKEVPQLSEELRRIAGKNAAVMFFIEGQRSRAREFLTPKRGLLRGLQATGKAFTILPISISYDRVPEEAAFERELTGGRRSRMSLKAIVHWLAQISTGDVQLGRVHLACGEPLHLGAETDVPRLARAVMAEQQRTTAVTDFHLRTFIAESGVSGVDQAWLKGAIERRGGRVLRSDLPVPEKMTPVLAQSLRNQWMHWFYADALALFPESKAVAAHVEAHGWADLPRAQELDDPRVRKVVEALTAYIRAEDTAPGKGRNNNKKMPRARKARAIATQDAQQ